MGEKTTKPTELIRVVDVAKALAVSKDTVRRLIALPAENPDRLPSVRVLGLVAVDRAELEAWIDRHRTSAPSEVGHRLAGRRRS
ncbi:MAG: helix-turn-helix domain-containing protein [Deltaproteobacteria bacterium]|nr:helix-turn-helix domain-containing protein [Deltaproteobacteria bacterium]